MINDLIDNVLTMERVFIAGITAFVSYLFFGFTERVYNSLGAFYASVIAFACLVGLQMVFLRLYKADNRQALQSFQLKIVSRRYLLRWRRILRPWQGISQILYRRIVGTYHSSRKGCPQAVKYNARIKGRAGFFKLL